VIYGIKVLTIKAVKLAMKRKNSQIDEIISDDIKAVEYLMSYYQEAKKSPMLLTNFLKDLGEDVKQINNLFHLGYNCG
jgi:sulfur relay (sulfurtransferase) DsrC/TusE family protein